MMNMKRFLIALSLLVAAVFAGCSIVSYSFSGTSIQPDVKTVTINYFEYKALKVNPNLSNDLTEAMTSSGNLRSWSRWRWTETLSFRGR